jgi:hypothetical protein
MRGQASPPTSGRIGACFAAAIECADKGSYRGSFAIGEMCDRMKNGNI